MAANVQSSKLHYHIPGYDNMYCITKDGNVWSYYTNRYLNIHVNSCGYKQVNLREGGKSKTMRIHRLLAMAFLPNPDNLPCVNHKDGDKQNNSLDNLGWCTQSDNLKHAHKVGLNTMPCQIGSKHSQAKLTEEDVIEMRWLRKMGALQKDIARAYGVSRGNCRDIINYRRWKHV